MMAGETQKTKYKRSLVAFIDILGFKQLVTTLPASELGKLRKDLAIARKVACAGPDEDWGFELYRAKMFSDSITMSIPLMKGGLFPFLLQILSFQGEMANRGIFMRGAVVVGNHFEDREVLFGPALIRAVELEKTLAIWPRIVVHPAVLKLALDPKLSLYPEQADKPNVARLLKQGADGISFIDYLRNFPEECDSADQSEQFLRNHQKYIVQKATANRSNLRVIAKYNWLATYHNIEMKRRRRLDLRVQKAKLFPGLTLRS